MKMEAVNFRDLNVWKLGKEIALDREGDRSDC